MHTVAFDVSALDPTFKAHAQRGIGRYVRELSQRFAAIDTGGIKVENFDFHRLRAHGSALTRMSSRFLDLVPIGRTTFRQQFLFPFQLRSFQEKSGVHLIHFPAHMDAPARGLGPYVLTVLDLIPLVCADLYRGSGLRFRFARWLELQAIRNATTLVCISENTARDVHQILGVPWERLVVTPLGVDKKFFDEVPRDDSVRERYKLGKDRPLFLYVGGIDPRKNIPFLVRAFSRLLVRAREENERLPLLCLAGGISKDREYPKLVRTIEAAGLTNDIVLPGYIPDNDLMALYQETTAFVFPSLYEGFGLPPLEAMAAGVPVVSSNTSAMPEVLGEAALLADPSDEEAFARNLWFLLTSETLRESLRDAGRRRSRLFSWDRTAALTLSAYERALAVTGVRR